MNIDLREIANQTGRTEADVAKSIIQVLAMKARIYGKTQHIILGVKKEVKCYKVVVEQKEVGY